MVDVKQKTLTIIQQLPDSCSFDEVMEALWVQKKILAGQEQIKNGRGVPHKEAKKRLEKWLK